MGISFVWGIYGRTKGNDERKERLGRLTWIDWCDVLSRPGHLPQCPSVLKRTQPGCRKSSGRQSIHMSKETAWSVAS